MQGIQREMVEENTVYNQGQWVRGDQEQPVLGLEAVNPGGGETRSKKKNHLPSTFFRKG